MAKIIYIMQDDFEKFVRDNREDFDMKTPSFKIWENIDKELNGEQKEFSPLKIVKSERHLTLRKRVLRYASVAAVGLLLLTVGGMIGSYFTANGGQEVAEVSFGEISEEYAEVEQFYAQQVNYQIEELKKHDYDKNILEDITELDIAFKELKQELGNSEVMSDEEIIHAMIENYQMKIAILERVLERIAPKGEEEEKIEL